MMKWRPVPMSPAMLCSVSVAAPANVISENDGGNEAHSPNVAHVDDRNRRRGTALDLLVAASP